LELYDTYQLSELGIESAEQFIDVYTEHNHRLWRDYHNGLISKEQLRSSRFRLTFEHFELPEHLIPRQFEDDYVSICPTKTNLFEGTHEVLSILKNDYKLHIITNGFLESQEMKMSRTNLKQYFEEVFISEVIGLYKPDIALFNHALVAVGAESHEVLMIGDSLEADILGAKNAGIDQVYFNPLSDPHNYEVTYEINKLHELLAFLK
jgi:putative hydrolase of the HAD superfamily